jgi:hypothetical protein
MNFIYECTRPDDASRETWPDCTTCKYANCGYSRCIEFNERWHEQAGTCGYEHCIETGGKRRCPLFGHACPGGLRQARECQKEKQEALHELEESEPGITEKASDLVGHHIGWSLSLANCLEQLQARLEGQVPQNSNGQAIDNTEPPVSGEAAVSR